MQKEETKRDELAEDARAEYDDVGTWDWGASLRHQWSAAQRLDKDLSPCFSKTWKPPHDERINANDGLVEKLVTPEGREPRWVPIVPNGHATRHMTWENGAFYKFILDSSVLTGTSK